MTTIFKTVNGWQFVDLPIQGAQKCNLNHQGLTVFLCGHKTTILWQFVSTRKSVAKTAKVASLDDTFEN